MQITHVHFVHVSATQIRVWSAVDGTHIHTFDEHACGVSALAVRRDGVVFSGSFDGCVCVWRGNDGVLLRRLRTGDRQKVVGICFGPAQHVTAATEDGALCTWSTDTRASARHRDESDGSIGDRRGGAPAGQGNDGMATLEQHTRSRRDSSAGDVELELSGKTTCSGCIVGLATSPNDSIGSEGILWMTTASGKLAWSTPGSFHGIHLSSCLALPCFCADLSGYIDINVSPVFVSFL